MTMPRQFQRRDFIRLALGSGALLPAIVLGEEQAAPGLQWLQLMDDRAAPLAVRGDWLAVDAATTAFAGDGLYLYPAWGEPQPYLVRRVAAPGGGSTWQEFCNPATRRVLWTDAGNPVFAGRVHGRLSGQTGAWLGRKPDLIPLRVLQVPRRPA
ncbi:MAG: hypothetical protein ACO3PV_00140 [Pseudohongiellaceae bacterium]|jgi:hypothetical protein